MLFLSFTIGKGWGSKNKPDSKWFMNIRNNVGARIDLWGPPTMNWWSMWSDVFKLYKLLISAINKSLSFNKFPAIPHAWNCLWSIYWDMQSNAFLKSKKSSVVILPTAENALEDLWFHYRVMLSFINVKLLFKFYLKGLLYQTINVVTTAEISIVNNKHCYWWQWLETMKE